jgi:ABC-2 type transport system ATP-binding protein
MSAAIEVEQLAKSFGDVEAVRGVSFEVARGEVFGFLGPNGAGKTTTIHMLCTLARPTGGRARVAGHDVARERDDVQSRLIKARMQQVLEMVDLWDRRDGQVAMFSGGMRRRLEIARGLMHSPRVLFLDEPTIGLDPQTRSSIWSYIRQLQEAEEITIFMTTHYMDEAEYCDRIAIMDRGQIVVLDTPEALKASVGADRVRIQTDDDAAAIAALAEQFAVEGVVAEGAVTFFVESGEEFVPRLFAELGVAIRSVSVSRPTLDDVFMSYTGSTIRDAEADQSADRNRIMMRVMTGGGRR